MNANLFLWPKSVEDYTADELIPNQDTEPRTIPDSGSDRGGFMSLEFTEDCLCFQFFSSRNEFLYSNWLPNYRMSEAPLRDCTDKCNPFVPSASSSDGLSAGIIAAIVICSVLGAVIIAVGIVFLCKRKQTSSGDAYRNME